MKLRSYPTLRVLIIDNYDSFTFNLVELLRPHSLQCRICYNDEVEPGLIQWADKILISPGPGKPEESGRLMETITIHHKTTPMLGICMGHQAIGEVFGSTLHQLEKPCHGKVVEVQVVADDSIIKDLPSVFQVGLYHSWTLKTETLAPCLQIIAQYQDRPMIIRHQQYPLFGIQFHPESYATKVGAQLISNWLSLN